MPDQSLEATVETIRAASKQFKALANLEEAASAVLAASKNADSLDKRLASLVFAVEDAEQKLANLREQAARTNEFARDELRKASDKESADRLALWAKHKEDCASLVENAKADAADTLDSVRAEREELGDLIAQCANLRGERDALAESLRTLREQAARIAS